MENGGNKYERGGVEPELNMGGIGSKVIDVANAVEEAANENNLNDPSGYNDLINELSHKVRNGEIK